MRIKRIEILGFKSFCERAVVHFASDATDERIIGVVGPNGCGKSNIVDAIRWCMGEQSAKHLRGQAMGDVIFAGSDSRGPAGMAEVSLTFEDVGFSHEELEGALGRDEDSLSDLELSTSADTERETDEGEDAAYPETQAHESNGSVDQAVAPCHEVSADSSLAVELSGYSEVTITRRLFRDGTSQYLLNKTPCRLRDITDFFLGTGVGTKAYSIIEQGRIGMIVSARAGDRRQIIEEAAGITKFKAKKRAAERKLEQTRQNLLRVSDIVEELAKRLGALRRQAQKAERYRGYKAEVKELEMCMASQRYLELQAQIKSIALDVETLRSDLEVARREFAARDAAVMAERGELVGEERRLSALQEQVFALENRIRLGESKMDFERREISDAEARISENNGEIRVLNEQKAAIDRDLQDHRDHLQGLAQANAQQEKEADAVGSRVSELRVVLAQAQAALGQARADVAQAHADIVRAESSQEVLRQRHSDALVRLTQVRSETAILNEQIASHESTSKRLQAELSGSIQTRLDLGNKNDEFSARKSTLVEEVETAEARVETLRTESHRRKSRLQSLVELHEKYEGFARGTRAVMQSSKTPNSATAQMGIRGLVADVIHAPEGLEAAVEATLGDRLGGVVVSSYNAGLQAIEYLKQTGSGRSTFVPCEASSHSIQFEDRSDWQAHPDGVLGSLVDLVGFDSDYQALGNSLLGDSLLVESLPKALQLRAQGCKRNLVTVDGDVVDSRGVLSGGSADAQVASVLAQKREIRDLQDILDSLDRDLAEATARYVGTKSELTRVSRALDALRNDRHDGELRITEQQKDLDRLQAELEQWRGRATQLNAEQLDLEERLRDLDDKLKQVQGTDSEAREVVAKFSEQEVSLSARSKALEIQVEQATLELTQARVEAAQSAEKCLSFERGLATLEQTSTELKLRMDKLEATIATDQARIVELKQESEKLVVELEEQRIGRTRITGELGDRRAKYEGRIADLQAVEVEIRDIRAVADRLAERVTSADVRHRELLSEQQRLEETIEDRYHVVLAKHIGDYHLRPLVTSAEAEQLAQRKKLIERMGADINLTAIDEFAEISERHDFLSTQRDDLENAVGQLEKAIARINKTSRRLFRETFHAINEKFKYMFPRLFRGGKASLALTGGPDMDVLEAGVEIMAQPPGKKNVTVDQLSGGEKALTAVALLFSIFVIKPSPFCVLDEVDAPLDEANVDLYNHILREMTDSSQFIVITHNKRTMSTVDRLYGVTMQEPGVSKLVSVNLNRIGENSQAA